MIRTETIAFPTTIGRWVLLRPSVNGLDTSGHTGGKSIDIPTNTLSGFHRNEFTKSIYLNHSNKWFWVTNTSKLYIGLQWSYPMSSSYKSGVINDSCYFLKRVFGNTTSMFTKWFKGISQLVLNKSFIIKTFHVF